MKKGLSGWVEIFRGGKQTDSSGKEHDGDALIDQAVSSFDSNVHEPPAVVGHPADNSPAFGWVAGLKKTGDTLLAKFKGVIPEFEDAVKKGLYKKRSASFYPDGRLRHVGFLGGTPPAVKGLTDIGFKSDEDQITFEFEDWRIPSIAGVFQRMREFIIEKFGADAADKVVSSWTIDELKQDPEIQAEPLFTEPKKKEGEDIMNYTEEQVNVRLDAQKTELNEKFAGLETKFDAAKADTRKEVEAEFAEKERTARREAAKQEITSFCDTMLKEGKIIPAWGKSGLSTFMENLEAVDVVEFSEGNKKSQLDWFKDFLKELPKVVDFGEIASREKDIGAGDAGAKLDRLVKDKMDKKEIGYNPAFAEVQAEHPDLVEEYMSEMKA